MKILEDIGIRYAGIFFFYIKEKQLDKKIIFITQTNKNIEKLNEVLKIICCFIFNDVLK